MSTTITARATVAGLHHWPDAPDRRAYLRHPHRHLFGLAATVVVEHEDRAVEWHDLADLMTRCVATYGTPYPETTLWDFGAQSCEALATHLAHDLTYHHGLTVLAVGVDEDGEHTATWHRHHEDA